MRSSTPKLNLAPQHGRHQPSPPQTPTTTTSPRLANRRNGMLFRPLLAKIDQNSGLGTITPHGDGPTFSYTPFSRLNPTDFSPRSSSPESSRPSSPTSSNDGDGSEDDSDDPQSRSSSPLASSPPLHRTRARIITTELATFTVEDYDSNCDSDISSSKSVMHPHAYEDAESERAASIRSTRSRKQDELDRRLLNKMKELDCEDEDREAWVEAMRAEKRRKRRSSSSVQKRTLSMSIGSDTDDEDLKPIMLDANEAGSSARRLRRKVGERASLIFDDPPARIDEEDEGLDNFEEVVEVDEEDDIIEGDGLPYWEFIQDMDVDSEDD